jgi:hypothetical protein
MTVTSLRLLQSTEMLMKMRMSLMTMMMMNVTDDDDDDECQLPFLHYDLYAADHRAHI